jgi:hypothetical protein
MRATLSEIKDELRRRMHQPIPEQGAWIEQVVRGFFAYHAVAEVRLHSVISSCTRSRAASTCEYAQTFIEVSPTQNPIRGCRDEKDDDNVAAALIVMGTMVASLEEANAVFCARGVYRAGCAGPRGAVVARRPLGIGDNNAKLEACLRNRCVVDTGVWGSSRQSCLP